MQVFSFPYQQYLKNELPEPVQKLVAAAETACLKAYAPYSNLKVGAAVLLEDGRIVSGANQENASYPVGICAERSLLSNINPVEHGVIKAMAVTYAADSRMDGKPITPCGMCRQSILEFQHRQQSPITVYMCGPAGEIIMIEDAELLLPFSFGGDNLRSALPGNEPGG